MEYYELLGLKKEPFMDTADPYFFYQSQTHKECLQRLEISVRLGRGLNVILGDIGLGKTTIAQKLQENLINEDQFLVREMLDPNFKSPLHFLEALRMLFDIRKRPFRNALHGKNYIKNFLFEKGVHEGKTIVLIVDEGQNLSDANLEILRILLNYQTPSRKLINIVIFGQLELLNKIKKKPNFSDRIAYFHILQPLTKQETANMINFRLHKAGLPKDKNLFSQKALDLIYEYTEGRPRKIVLLCQRSIEEVIIKGKDIIDESIVNHIVESNERLLSQVGYINDGLEVEEIKYNDNLTDNQGKNNEVQEQKEEKKEKKLSIIDRFKVLFTGSI